MSLPLFLITCMSMRSYVILILLFIGISLQGIAAPSVSARSYAALVMNHRGQILHHVNAHQQVYPASLTKMMTLYLVFEALHQKKIRLSDRISLSAFAASQPPSKLPLKKGESLTVKQAILALATKSANNIAVALAEKLAGSEAAFARRMSQKARVLGLKNTFFRNASGFFHPGQHTTAYDMALLGRALVRRFPAEYRYFNTKNFIFRGVVYKNHNHLLGQIPGLDGIKTGYIEKAGFNLVASVQRKGQRLFVVVMGGKTGCWRNQHVASLIQAAYTEPHRLAHVTAQACPPPVSHMVLAQNSMIKKTSSSPSIDNLLTLAEQKNHS